jgi:hypothetical protein
LVEFSHACGIPVFLGALESSALENGSNPGGSGHGQQQGPEVPMLRTLTRRPSIEEGHAVVEGGGWDGGTDIHLWTGVAHGVVGH